jgi:hypothetical protein
MLVTAGLFRTSLCALTTLRLPCKLGVDAAIVRAHADLTMRLASGAAVVVATTLDDAARAPSGFGTGDNDEDNDCVGGGGGGSLFPLETLHLDGTLPAQMERCTGIGNDVTHQLLRSVPRLQSLSLARNTSLVSLSTSNPSASPSSSASGANANVDAFPLLRALHFFECTAAGFGGSPLFNATMSAQLCTLKLVDCSM